MRIPRREMLKLTALGAAGSLYGCGDDAEESLVIDENVVHLLPTSSSDRIFLKASFLEPLESAPELRVDGGIVAGIRTDADGYFYAFDATGLAPARSYQLELRAGRSLLAEPWALRTLPAPDASPARLRILAFTCAGGHDVLGFQLPTSIRRRLLRRALSFSPDIAIANGDHVYWDLVHGIGANFLGGSDTAVEFAGAFDRNVPVLGTDNEEVLRRAVDNQIAELYGTLFRSVPTFFLRDDHDYFENDEFREGEAGEPDRFSFPPDAFSLELARATQWLYYPELLGDVHLPTSLPGTNAADRPPEVSEAFGSLRYGRLFEGLMYDCKGFLRHGGDAATLIPTEVEAWLMSRMRQSDATHVVNLPTNPPAYTAGKYAEWYPDVLEGDQLTTELPKPGWQEGWLAQHDRILAAASAMDRLALFVSGDIHSHAEARILRTGEVDLSENPVISVITGTPGATGAGWPSGFRGTRAMPSGVLEVEEGLEAIEENGFNLIDVEPERITVRTFRWDGETEDPATIDSLEPFRTSVFER